jgi:flavin-dependent dehydrogenase
MVHWGSGSMSISPPDPSRRVLSVYRGGGPRHSPYPPAAGFDAFLQREAEKRGARIVHERVDEVSFDPRPRVYTSNCAETFDLAVLATGVNSTTPVLHGLDYSRPATETMAQDSLLLAGDAGHKQMESTVHVFFDQPKGSFFGALIPKCNFANISLLGRRLSADCIREFLAAPEVRFVIGDNPPQTCGCRPRVAVTLARGFYADRFVAIGDCCITRLYKDGIGSALVTARAAAETALRYGFTREAFAAQYAPMCRAIARDNRFGRAVFALTARSRRNGFSMRALARAVASEANSAPEAAPLSRILWSLFTGDAGYEEIFRMMIHAGTVARLLKAMLLELRFGRSHSISASETVMQKEAPDQP